MILDERIKKDEIEKRKVIIANAGELAKKIGEKARDESCSEALYFGNGNINPNARTINIDTGDGKEKYYIYMSEKYISYGNYDITKKIEERISNPLVRIGLRDDVRVDFFIPKDKEGRVDSEYYYLDEKGESFGSRIDFSKVEGDTFIERLISIEDEYCSKFEPELAEKYKECFNILKGMLQPFVVQDLHHETEEAKYRREIKEKIESLEKELAEKKQELEAEKEAHQATRGELEVEKRRRESTEEKYETMTKAYQRSQNDLSDEKNAHDKTSLELYNERQAHNKTKSDLEKEKEEHGKTKQFLSALGDAVKAAATSKLPKTGKAFMTDIKEKFSNIVRGKGIEDKEDILSK